MQLSVLPIPAVVHQHVEESARLRHTRSYLRSAPQIGLHQLGRLDQRLVAHLDGLAVAGEHGRKIATDALKNAGRGEVFTATVRAIESRDVEGINRLFGLVEAQPNGGSGLLSAFGWASAASLRGINQKLLGSANALRRQVGLAACAMHRVDPGMAVDTALRDADVALRTRALRVISDRGRVDLRPACLEALNDADERAVQAAARCAVLLGDRGVSVDRLRDASSTPGPWRRDALGLLLMLLVPPEAHAALRALSRDTGDMRLLVWAVGAAGDPHYVPWLIDQMRDPKFARVAGESFSTITGLDLVKLDLERRPSEPLDTGPSDDPDDEDVSMDEDDGLPWPDPDKVAAWWQANSHRFTPGTRYFMGQPPSPAHCLSVLKNGFQRQRIAAAEYLTLMNPGTPLFNCAAPAWRQQRWLATMGA